MNNQIYDVAIIGGGASGLAAGAYIKAYKENKNIIILEKEQRVGKRLLVTGSGRCNITNTSLSSKNYHGGGLEYIGQLLDEFTCDKLRDELSKLGILTREDSSGRVYPYTEQASSVLDVLRMYTRNCEKTECTVKKVSYKNALFTVEHSLGLTYAKSIIIACGGYVQPKLGANGSGYTLAKMLGHNIIRQSPSLAPIYVNEKLLPSLKGIRCACTVKLLNNESVLKEESGELQFNENAISGICVFQLSHYINKMFCENKRDMVISINFMPEYCVKELEQLIRSRADDKRELTLEELFIGILNKRIGQAILKKLGITPLSRLCKELSDKEIKSIVNLISDWRFSPYAPSDINKAQVTSGGVDANEIDFKTMQSKIVPGLYFAGEIIDVDGECGGYNLHFAVSSGIRAAKSCTEGK